METNINYGEMRPLYLLSEKGKPSTTRFSKALGVSDDQLLRSLSKEFLTGKDLHEEIEPYVLSKIGGVLAVDDSVQDRLWSHKTKSDLIGQHYSGNHKPIVNGVDVITLFRVVEEQQLPINFRIFSTENNKTKHALFLEMIDEVLSWGYKPSVVTADSYYATNDNIERLIKKGLSIFMGVKSNRKVRELHQFGTVDGANYSSLCDVSIPYQGKILHFRGLGMFKTFMYEDKYYIYHNAQDKEMINYEESEKLAREEANRIHRNHWYIEEYHRVLKQLCNFEGMIFRSGIRIVNHIFYSIKAFCILEITRFKKGLKNWYATITNDTIKYTADMMNNLSLSGLCITS